MRQLVVAAIVLGAATASADAEDTRVKLFPLSSTKSMKPAASELTEVLSRSFGAETATVSIDDAAGVLGCTVTERVCLDAIAGSVGVETIMFGRVEETDDGARVKITSFEVESGQSQRTFTLVGDSPEALAEALRAELEARKPKPAPRVIDVTPIPPAPASGGVTTGTWAMIIGGGVTLGVGLGVVVSANALRKEAATAPTDTIEDIEYLLALEKAGTQRVQIGGALAVVGGAVATVGVIRAIVQKRTPRPEEPRLDLVPEVGGGASVLFTVGWR